MALLRFDRHLKGAVFADAIDPPAQGVELDGVAVTLRDRAVKFRA